MNEIICGDALSSLKTLPDGIVQTCVTSPPYFGLRDYGVEGQIGLEDTPEAYIARLVEVFREVRRVLRDDGTLWCNIGDSYWNSTFIREKATDGWANKGDGEAYDSYYAKNGGGVDGGKRRSIKHPYLKEKDLIGIPWMLAFALRADGWYLRSDIIWHKPNCMPESVEDRPTKAHEYIFLLSKSANYFYDAEAIREPHTRLWDERNGGNITEATGHKKHFFIAERETPKPYPMPHPAGRNKRSVWTVSTMPYSEAHFATFPPKLIEPCILAGTSARACEVCGAPWKRVLSAATGGSIGTSWHDHTNDLIVGNRVSDKRAKGGHGYIPPQTTGWQPTCTCANNTGSGSCIVLDPFAGAGTVPLVALKYHRAYIGIELNQSYIDLANKRIHTTQPVLWEVSA